MIYFADWHGNPRGMGKPIPYKGEGGAARDEAPGVEKGARLGRRPLRGDECAQWVMEFG
jgi:hypothetical protein